MRYIVPGKNTSSTMSSENIRDYLVDFMLNCCHLDGEFALKKSSLNTVSREERGIPCQLNTTLVILL